MSNAGRWVGTAVAAVALACAVGPAPAAAHPLGLPAFAQIVAGDGGEVVITWNAAADDVAALARSLGVAVPAGEVLTRSQDAAFSESQVLAEALEEKVAVRQGERRCAADVEVTSMVEAGARWRFACAEPVALVDVTISLLLDIDERYRTLASAATPAGPQRLMFTSAAPTHRIELQTGGETTADAPLTDRAAPEDTAGQAFGGSLLFESRFVALIDRGAGAGGLVLGVLLALGIGALHGLAPGHGKAVTAAYLVGDRGRPRDALLLGGVVAGMHTWSVLALGLALYWATQRPATAALSAWLQMVSGVVVAVLGCWLLVRRLRERRHGDDHAHDHAPTAGDEHPLSWPGLVALGAAGGLLPSPSALLVLFTALTVDRVPYGLTLIAAFSTGLAATVSAIGLAVLRGRDVLSRRLGTNGSGWQRLAAAAPLAAAGAVALFGLAVAGSAAANVFGLS